MSDITRKSEDRGLPNEPYTSLADAYVAGRETAFSEAMAAFVLERATSLRPGRLTRVADIACGAGAACIVFGKHGLEVTGVDKSAHMIRHAEANARHAGLSIRFLVADYRELDLSEVDLVTCMYDSLNFMLTDLDLAKAFAAVRRALAEAGLFIFDMYTIRGLAETWGARAEIHTLEADHFIATQTAWDYETMSNTKTLYGFSRARDGQWHRWEERHHMRAYAVHQLRELLIASGFEVKDILDWDDPQRRKFSEQTHRAVFIAQRI